MNTPLSNESQIQEKYNISNRRAIRAILRSPIYRVNEATEMELGIKKISHLNLRNTLNMIGKIALQTSTLHNVIFRKAIEHRTPTTQYWKDLLLKVNVTDFRHIPEHCENNYINWKRIVKNT